MEAEINSNLPQLEKLTSPESFLSDMKAIDGWEVIDSPIFAGAKKLVKTRRKEDNITIHFDPKKERFYKVAEDPTLGTKLEKEILPWNVSLQVFGAHESILLKDITVDSNGKAKKSKYLDMPYMGIRINHFYAMLPHLVTEEVIDTFTEGMDRIIKEHGLYHRDQNVGNIVVRVVDGVVRLFPIDWETVRRAKTPEDTEHFLNTQVKNRDFLYKSFLQGRRE